jgi:riboflavin kinase/FMN adenylyltransferase
MGRLGVDVVITHPFSPQLASRTAQDFMADVAAHLGLRHLCVGYDFALGRKREGDVHALQVLGEQLGYTLQVVPAVEVDGQVVSSSMIRSYLASGEVNRAAGLLGRPYNVSGEVVPGDGRGKLLGIPTANLNIWNERAIPKAGVYACRATIDGREWGAVTNIGVRPTFESQPVPPRVETHILDFSDEIYGQQLCLEFLRQLRDEIRFPGPAALVEQIHRDITQAQDVFESDSSQRTLEVGTLLSGSCNAPVS